MTRINHIIKRQTLSLELPRGTDTWKMQDKFREALYNDVLPRLEKVCNELGFGKDVTIRLDQLILDLGTIAKPNMHTEWANRVEMCFREELTKRKQEKSPNQSVVAPSSPRESALDTLLYFLEKGAMPWWVSECSNESPQTTINKLLKEQSSALISQIKKLSNKAAVARRLILQFDKPTIDELLQLFDKPGVHKALSWLSQQVNSLESKLSDEVQNELSLARIRSAIDPDAFQGSDQKLFESIFESIYELKNSEASSTLNQIRKKLTARAGSNRANRAEDAPNADLALQVLNQLFDSRSKTKTRTVLEAGTNKPYGADKQPKGQEYLEEEKNNSNNPAVFKQAGKAPQPKDKAWEHSNSRDSQRAFQNSDSEQYFQEQTKDTSGNNNSVDQPQTEADKVTADQTTIQDQRVWEHIERIKKQQLTQLQADENQNTRTSERALEDTTHRANKPEQPGQSEQRQVTNKPGGQINNEAENNPTNSEVIDPTTSQSFQTNQFPAQTDGHIDPTGLKNTPQQSGSPDGTYSPKDPEKGEHKATNHKSYEPEHERPEFWQDQLETLDECYVQNAGLVLFWPYLGHFFKELGLVADGTFLSAAHQRQAALILQYLAEDKPELNEYKLPLNKLMAGLTISEPVQRHMDLSDADITKCRKLLEATIGNWPALKGTSVPGFRSSFLKRNGLLKRHDSHWQLQVENMPFDMLMEQLPWPISIVRLSWMKKPIYVEW